MRTSAMALAAVLLCACGNGGDGDEDDDVDPITYFEISDPTSTESSQLVGHALPSGTAVTTQITGQLDRLDNRATVGSLSGDINSARTVIDIDGGGTITLADLATAYVTTFSSQPSVGTPSIGVVGVATDTSDIPTTGTVTIYANTAGSNVQIIDGTSVYDLTGSVTANVVFSGNDVDLVFDDLDGTRSTGVSAPEAVSDVATITIDNAVISGNVFSGGTATFNSTQIASTLSGSQTIDTSGGFYGPDADEIGGVFVIDDGAGATLLIQGAFVAD